MSELFDPRLDILADPQRRVWAEIGALAEFGFVLYGGTAIALQIGHRSSIDFDITFLIPGTYQAP